MRRFSIVRNRDGLSQIRALAVLSLSGLAVLWLSSQEASCRALVRKAPPSGSESSATEVSPEPQALDLQESFARVAAAAKQSVVSITTVHVENVEAVPHQFYFGDPFEDFFQDFFGEQSPAPRRGRPRPEPRRYQQRQEGLGSGVIVDPKGYVLTNEHVVHGADQIKVRLLEPEERVYTAKVVGTDPSTDLAVVKINADRTFPAASLGDSDKVRVGDWAIAVGSPFGLEHTVTVGVVSAVRQSLNIENRQYSGFLQTDAAINRGNSGGPLLDIRGNVIGINTAIYAPTGVFAGVGFAIPANRAKEIMEQLIEKGRVIRGWFGVEVAPVDPVIARQFGLPTEKGVLVNKVMEGSPAAKAGLRRGDVIVSINGEATTDVPLLMRVVANTPPKTKVKVEFFRDGSKKETSLTTGERPTDADASEEDAAPEPERQDGEAMDWNGARLITLTRPLARRFGIQAESGVLVVGVEPGGAAEDAGLVEGDLIQAVNRKPTPDAGSFAGVMKSVDLKEGVMFDVNRGGRLIYLTYRSEE